MSDEKKLPKRRFKQFLNTPSWEQRKFADVFNTMQNNTLSRSELGFEIGEVKNVHYGDVLIKYGDFINVAIDKLPYIKDGQIVKRFSGSLLKDGDIIIADTAEDSTVGKCSEIIGTSDIKVLSGLHTIPCRPKEKYAPKYMGYYINSNAYHRQLIPLMQGIKVTSISRGAIKDTNVFFPKSYDEQAKIGESLSNIDNLITLHQRKLNKLEKLKKAYLEELFPTGNQCKPKRRFKEFKDDWEQRKLTDISKTFIGLVTTMTTNYREAGTLLVRNSDIRDNKFIFSEKPIYLDSEFAKSNESRKLKSGDVVTVHTGDIGTSAVVEEDIEGAIGFATINTRPDINYLDPHFLSTYFNTERHKKYAISVATGDGRSNYNIKDFNKLMLYMPSINEQKAIAEFIKRITDLITLHQRKLEKLKKLKTAYLDELFV